MPLALPKPRSVVLIPYTNFMNRKLLLIIVLVFITITETHAQSQRTKYNFNSDWKVFVGDPAEAQQVTFDDASWKNVTLPYAWNEDDAFKKDIVDLSTGIAWYRKTFKLPANSKGQKIFIEFEGIRQAGECYINGKKVGLHENGVMAFGFDVTEYMNVGSAENVIAVRIDNDWNYREKSTNSKFQWEDKNFNANYGGISKNVYLHITHKIYQTLPLFANLGTTGTYIYASDFNIKAGAAIIHAASQVKNETMQAQKVSFQTNIYEQNGVLLKTFSGEDVTINAGAEATVQASSLVHGLHFWSWGYGYLYNVQTILKINNQPVDAVITKTGFRKTAFKDGMTYLNDRVLMVHGYAQRTSNEWPAVGLSVPAWLSDYSNGLMVESNANLVRWMHITPWKQDIESCDRVGLLQAMQAGDAEKDVEGVRWEQRKQVMRDAIIYNRNNPSIVFYECGNESISEAHMKEMKEIRDAYDPHGGRAIGSREMLNSKTAEYGGEMLYVNKSAHIPMWAMEYSRDEGSRKYWDDYTTPFHKDGDGPLHNGQSAAIYNRNMESHAVENVHRWYDFWKERPGTGKRVNGGGVNIVFSETNTHHRGAENYRRSGEVDGMRIKKQNFYAHQIMWDGWVSPEKPGIHIIGHWNYEAGIVKDIYVISSAEKVALTINGKSIGFGTQQSRFLYVFKQVRYEPGSIAAVGYDAAGKINCSTKIETVGAPVALRLKLINRPTAFKADGQDLQLIEVEVVDAKGQRCPTALDVIQFSLKGPAVYRGGMAMGKDNYILSDSLSVEGGVNRVLVRSTKQPGKIILQAKAAGLKPATIEFTSTEFLTRDGLTTILPSDGLPSKLQRGPTPATPSYSITRIPLTIVNATAGSNADSIYKSYDDNELTDWVNDGKIATAWVEYELDKAAKVTEVTLKLNNFRSRSYPLLITVDGKEIYRGNTPTGLGYCTLLCKPVPGKKLRIALLAASTTEGTNTMVEVSGKKLDDGVARDDSKAKGSLSIIEAELYSSEK